MGGTHSRQRSHSTRRKFSKSDSNAPGVYGYPFPVPTHPGWPYPNQQQNGGGNPGAYMTYPASGYPQGFPPQGYPATMPVPPPGWPQQPQYAPYMGMQYGGYPGMQPMIHAPPQPPPEQQQQQQQQQQLVIPAPPPQQQEQPPPPAPPSSHHTRPPSEPSSRRLFAPFTEPDPSAAAPLPMSAPTACMLPMRTSPPKITNPSAPSPPTSDSEPTINVRSPSVSPPLSAGSYGSSGSRGGGHHRRSASTSTSLSAAVAVGTGAQTPLLNPLPTPPRDIYELSPYRPLMQLKDSLVQRGTSNSTEGPESPTESTTSAMAFLTPVVPVAAAAAPVVVPPPVPAKDNGVKKKKRGFFGSLVRRRKANPPLETVQEVPSPQPATPQFLQVPGVLPPSSTARPMIPVKWRVVPQSEVPAPLGTASLRSPPQEQREQHHFEPAPQTVTPPESPPRVEVVVPMEEHERQHHRDEERDALMAEPLITIPSSDSAASESLHGRRHHSRHASESAAVAAAHNSLSNEWLLRPPVHEPMAYGSPRPRMASPAEPASPLPLPIPAPQMSPIRSPRALQQQQQQRPPLVFSTGVYPHLAGLMLTSPYPVRYNHRWYPSAFHLLEASKFMREEDDPHAAEFADLAERVCRCQTVEEVQAFVKGAQKWVRKDWEDIILWKVDDIQYLKFNQHPVLGGLLVGTGDAELIYAEPGDPYWGVDSSGNGRNELGRSLMRVREMLNEDNARRR